MAVKPNCYKNNAENDRHQNGASLVCVQFIILGIEVILRGKVKAVSAILAVRDVTAMNLCITRCETNARDGRCAACRRRTVHYNAMTNAMMSAANPKSIYRPIVKINVIKAIMLNPLRAIVWQAPTDTYSHTFDAQIVYFFFRVGHRRKPRVFWL